MKLNLSYISSVIFRVLPTVKYNFDILNYLYYDKEITNYFKNVRILQEYPGLSAIFSSHGFDMSLYHQIVSEAKNTKRSFLSNIKEASLLYCNPKKNLKLCGLTQSHLNFISYRFKLDVFDSNSGTFKRPSTQDVLDSVNLSASQGLPNPYLKKRDVISDIQGVLSSFNSKRLKFSDIFSYPSAIFMRSQIRSSGLKFRLVHAVQAKQQAIESFFYMYFSSALTKESSITIGFTQLEVSQLMKKYDPYYTYCFDYSKWDILRQPVLSVISFELIRNCLPLDRFESKVLTMCRNYYLTLPSFHPSIELKRRSIGTVSGSGFTSLDNSLCNWVHMCVVIFDYCEIKGLDPYNFNFKINTSGDDLIFGSNIEIDPELFILLSKKRFNSILRLECDVSKPGTSDYFFLGSNWKNGFPFRSEKVLVCSTIFGSGNFPKMSTEELFQSRFFEVFGNTSDTLFYWKRIRLYKKPLKRLFFFNELFSPFRSGNQFSMRNRLLLSRIETFRKKDSRGFWYSTPLTDNVISSLWQMR